MSRIKRVRARQITDSRGHPTVEARVYLESGVVGWAGVPSGASTGSREAIELRDKDPSAFRGKGVSGAVANVNGRIDLALRRQQAQEQQLIDQIMIDMDGTPNKANLGANAILAVSLAVADAASKEVVGEGRLFEYIAALYGQGPARLLPVPMMNVINGGEHADNDLRVQEFMIMPIGASSIWEALKMGSRVFHSLDALVERLPSNPAVGVGDEGGYAPVLAPGQGQEAKVNAAIDLILSAIEMAGLAPGSDIVLALDVAASEFHNSDGSYEFGRERISTDDMVDLYERLLARYPICSIEDGLAEGDGAGWAAMTRRLGARVQLVGDDLFVTNKRILASGIEAGMANAVLVKPNQIGTVTETLQTIELARSSAYACVVSHRSGETLDTKIADIAVGCNTGQIKTGSMSRGDRIAKYNRLKDIELGLGESAEYPGVSLFERFRCPNGRSVGYAP